MLTVFQSFLNVKKKIFWLTVISLLYSRIPDLISAAHDKPLPVLPSVSRCCFSSFPQMSCF